jgi:hypothetical protein
MANFQNIIPVKIAQNALTTSAVLAYTVPAATRLMIKNINVCNTTAGALTFNIFLVPSGGSPATTNALYYQNSLASYASTQWSGVTMLNAGDMIYVQASGTGITAIISGAECV